MLPVILGLAAAAAVAWLDSLGSAILAFVVVLLWRRLTDVGEEQAALRNDLRELGALHARLQHELESLKGQGKPAPPPKPPLLVPPLPADEAQPVAAAVATGPTFHERVEEPSEPLAAGGGPARSQPFPAPTWLIEFFTTGNIVAKVGMVIVFFGVAFLVRYAADRGLLPIEYRLMATVAGALVLLGAGWRLRRTRPDFAVVLQGGAVGVLYLTIFAAFRLYALLPAALTFALLLVVVAVSGALAILQNAMALAVLGTSGGFLAPILASTGGGSHVALFSYYAVLNGGVLGIAWFRAWRFLNWLAFVFTFGIGFLWGQEYYRPELFATTEPFLVGFFLLFLAVAVLFAHRQPPQLRGYVDGSLVFGAPAVAFAMQSVLVRDVAFGRAYSAVALAAIYLALARWLSRRDRALRPLAEAFLALAAVFLILAVPLAFDGHATAAAWALEGAGLVWIGIRQHRLLARVAGSALLLGAGVAFLAMASPPPGGLPVLNAFFLGCVAIAAGSLIAGRLVSISLPALTERERPLEWVLVVWGLGWWFGAVLLEIDTHVRSRLASPAMLLAASASLCLVGFVARRLHWRAMMLATIPIGPMMWILVVPAFAFASEAGLLRDLGWLGWAAVVAGSYLLIFWFESTWPPPAVRMWHAGATWLLVFLATWTVAVAVRRLVPEAPTWASTVWCIVPAAAVLAFVRAGDSAIWPVGPNGRFYAGPIAGALAAVILLWVALACGRVGSAAPLPYVPVLNPLELTQAFALVVALAWWRRRRVDAPDEGRDTVVRAGIAVLAFASLNMVIGRAVHHYLQVPFTLDTLGDSYVFQAGISILWGVTAGVLMTVSRIRLDRAVWMMGAGLLAALILKLFLVDLGNVGGVARIVSFLATGILILAIGYFAPAPPKTERAA